MFPIRRQQIDPPPARQRAAPAPARHATLALWGIENAGKSALLASFEAASRGERISIYPLDEHTETTMRAWREQRANHRFPTPTPVPTSFEQPSLLRFGLEPRRSKQRIALTIADVGGRWWREFSADATDSASFSASAWSLHELLLGKCDGLLCLLDPTQALQRAYMPEMTAIPPPETTEGAAPEPDAAVELQAILARLRRARQAVGVASDLKVAVCLAQMDRPEHYGHLGHEQAYFTRLYRNLPFQNWVAARNLRFFGCSAAGVLRRAGYITSNTFKDQHGQEQLVDPSVPPLHVFQPIKWLLGLA